VSSQQTLLLIADIGGYTRFMRLHRTSLAHAEVTTARLLEKIIDAARGFDLVEVEGDAAFLARETTADGSPVAATTETAVAMHRAFHAERHRIATNMCPCHGCEMAADLTLKFVAHLGEVARQTVKRRTKLVGVDVIHVHRLLKNSVPVSEYVLLSDELYRAEPSSLPTPVRELEEQLEGIGSARVHFVEVEALAGPLPPPATPSLASRVAGTAGMLGRGLPYMLGLRRRRSTAPAH
jgi:hypothetical protein